uniref:EGF-like domain-containing protein n=1 Tax=Steinernema glaseri TaxID=37863 RepID=A0A1I8APK2_9BILA
MRSIPLVIFFVAYKLLFVAAEPEVASDVCKQDPSPCGLGTCTPLKKGRFLCNCTECFAGPRCEQNICEMQWQITVPKPLNRSQKVVRTVLTGLVILMALLAVVCFWKDRSAWARIKKRIRENVPADSSEISRITYHNSEDEGSVCGRIHSAVSWNRTKTAMSSRTLARVPSLTTLEVISMEKPRRLAWDEVEMRRHGYVDRMCRRPEEVDPKSIDVSIVEPTTNFSTMQASASGKKPGSLGTSATQATSATTLTPTPSAKGILSQAIGNGFVEGARDKTFQKIAL